ncbi:MAG TPA: S9 family peptidase [Bacillales bacterium]
MVSTEEKLLAYLNAKSAYQSQAIPTKNKFTFISKLTGIPQMWTLDENQGPVQLGHFADRVMSVHHSPQGDKTVIGMDHKGNEKQQLYLLRETDAEAETLICAPEYFHNFGGWSPDGRQITFSSNRRHPGYFDVFVQDVLTKEVETVFQFDGKCVPLSWLQDGEHILISIAETNIDNAIYILNLITNEITRIGKKETPASYQSIELTKDGKGGYLLTDSGEETTYLCRFFFDHPDQLEILDNVAEWDIEGLKLSPNESRLIFTLNEGGISRLWMLDLHTKRKNTIEGIPDGVIESLSWLNDDQFIFTLKTPTMPGDIWCYTLSEEKLKRLTNVGQSEVEGLWKEPELCSFPSFDNLEIPYFYYEKEPGVNKPAVVYVHGGPESQIRAVYNPVIQYLVNQGFAVAAPNVRGSKGYGRTYIKLDDVRKRMDSVKDLSGLVQDLVSSHGVSSEKIGIMGRSYGGFMVLAALTHFPDLWAAGVDIVGISHFKTFLQNTGAWRRHLRESEYGSLEHDADFFEEIAPLNHSDKITAPLLVFHGRNDTRVPVSEAEQLVSDMKKRKQTVEFHVFEDEGHQTEKIENHITMHSRTVAFMEQYLKES